MSKSYWINVWAANKEMPQRLGVMIAESREEADWNASDAPGLLYRLKVTPKATTACAADAGQVPGLTPNPPPKAPQ